MLYISQIVTLTDVNTAALQKLCNKNTALQLYMRQYRLCGESHDIGYMYYKSLRGTINSLLETHNYLASTLPLHIC